MLKFNPDYKSRFRILKGGKISLVVSAILASTTLSFASPVGGVVTSGTAIIDQIGTTTNITQSTDKVTINWQDFSIATNETVNFAQPSVSSIALNRVVGNETSIIDGALNANGQVWILNSNGILFNSTARINTAGILATTKSLSDADFNAGNYKFTGDSTASVINMGTIEASDSGYVALLANTVSNEGTIKAYKGTVYLTGASEATINLNGNSIVSLTVDKGVLDALVENKGAIIAEGGKIYLTTNAVDELLRGVVNNTGIIEANSIDDMMGEVILFAHGGEAQIGGTIHALDGFVETSGKEFNFLGADIQAGEWLIDPVNITINEALALTIGNVLGNTGDVTIETVAYTTPSNSNVNTTANESGTDGDITVAADISYEVGVTHTLTLKAHRDIIFSDGVDITLSGTNAGGINVVLWADSDGNDAGGVTFLGNNAISTKGGDLWMGGGDGSTTWNGLTVGDSYAKGTGVSGTAGIDLNGATIYTNGGDIKMYGYAPSSGGSGIKLTNSIISTQANSTSTTASGSIDLRGDGWYTGAANGHGILVDGSSIIGGSGGVTIEGHASVNDIGTWSAPFFFGTQQSTQSSEVYTLSTGAINFNLYSTDVTSDYSYNNFMQSDFPDGNPNNLTTTIGKDGEYGNITITTHGDSNAGLHLPNIFTGGNLIIDISDSQNIGSGATAGWDTSSPWNTIDISAGDNSRLAIGGTTTIIGNAGSTASVRFTRSVDPKNTFGGNFIASGIKNLELMSGSAINLGAISTTGTIDIATNPYGDITLKGAIATTSTAENAILLNAGEARIVGQTTGGNIIINGGSITTDGGVKLYTGTLNENLSALVNNNTDYIKYNSDENTIFDPALDATRKYVIVRGAEPEPTPSPTPDPTPAPSNDEPVVQESGVDDVITTIINNEQIKVVLPKLPTALNIVVPKVPQQVSFKGQSVSLVSSPQGAQETQKITLTEVQELQKGQEDGAVSGGFQETRVPIGGGSIVELVNGGVALPEGVDQEFYAVKTEN